MVDLFSTERKLAVLLEPQCNWQIVTDRPPSHCANTTQ